MVSHWDVALRRGLTFQSFLWEWAGRRGSCGWISFSILSNTVCLLSRPRMCLRYFHNFLVLLMISWDGFPYIHLVSIEWKFSLSRPFWSLFDFSLRNLWNVSRLDIAIQFGYFKLEISNVKLAYTSIQYKPKPHYTLGQ